MQQAKDRLQKILDSEYAEAKRIQEDLISSGYDAHPAVQTAIQDAEILDFQQTKTANEIWGSQPNDISPTEDETAAAPWEHTGILSAS
jgi:hypothetical protein